MNAPAGEILKMTLDEWRTEGTRLFGENYHDWRFACPICGHVAAVSDYRQFKDAGASPNSATCECIGRYTRVDGFRAKGKGPCDYAGYGLFHASPIRIDNDGHVTHCFAFAAPTTKGDAE